MALKLVKDTISEDTVEALKELLSQANDGDLVGLAFVGIYRRSEFIVNSAGEAHRNPTAARGMVAALDDYLSQRVHA